MDNKFVILISEFGVKILGFDILTRYKNVHLPLWAVLNYQV